MTAYASLPDTSGSEDCPGVFVCPKSRGIVYRFIMDSPYTNQGLNWMSDCGGRMLYAESVAREDERRFQHYAHENRQHVVVEVRKNWRNTSKDTDVFVGLFMHTGRIEEKKSARKRIVRCFELTRVD